jgi:hypothetical protein
MKNKNAYISLLFIVTLLVASCSIQAGHLSFERDASPFKIINVYHEFSSSILEEGLNGINVHLKDNDDYRMVAGQPILPISVKTIELPLGSRIIDVSCVTSDVEELCLEGDIVPARKPAFSIGTLSQPELVYEPSIYQRDSLFPGSWYEIRASAGLDKDDQHTTFISVQFNPVRYNPVKRVISSVTSISLEITVDQPDSSPVVFAEEYDMVIICHNRYASILKPLVEHKNNHGIKTILIPVKDIYRSTYFPVQGRDCAEEIKYFIRDAVESWNITYVMLVGNFRQVPRRLTYLETDTGGLYEELKFATDLYYADIYDSDGGFSSWDTDNDGIYGEWPYPEGHPQVDAVDLVPDVHLGRLACMFKSEVRTVVDKIINYENGAAGSPWFNTIILAGGDTFDKSWEDGTDYNEGEEANEKAMEYMTGFKPVKLWTSLGNLTTENMLNEIGKGAGFLYIVGHGSPKNWATHVNGDYVNWTGNLRTKNMPSLSNKGEHPIVVVGGCHNSEFDVTPLNFIRGILDEGLSFFVYNEDHFGGYYLHSYVLECWSWVFVRVRGGAIATIGSVGFGGVSIGDHNKNLIPDCVEGLDGWFETQFFRLYNQDHVDVLGQAYSQVITDYANKFPVDTYRYDCKVLETHALLGDPSLKIGGYE